MTTTVRYTCLCCAHRTLDQKPPGTFATCPVCGWEDDSVQYAAQDMSDGANPVSLNQARENFRDFGAITQGARERVREPLPEELPHVQGPGKAGRNKGQ